MTFHVDPLPGRNFGAIVTGLGPDQLDDPSVRRRLRELWIDRGLIVFRDTTDGADAHVRLSRIFGDLEIHPVQQAHNSGNPEIIDIRYRPDDGNIYRIEGERIANWQPWHTDLAYTVGRNRGGILRALALPAAHGETGFIDQIESYEALPQNLRERIVGLQVVYQLDLDGSSVRFGRRRSIERLRPGSAVVRAMSRKWPRVQHPIVYRHPDSGRTLLNFSPWHAVGISGMENAEGDALLDEVARYATDEARAYDHRWQLGDMVLWDNWRMLHCSRGMSEVETRHLQRTTITGDYALGSEAN